MTKRLLDIKDLKVHFPVYGGILSKIVAVVKAVDGITFPINEKETIGLVGESGCGKTTVGRAIINILKHVAPDVKISGNINYHHENQSIDFVKIPPKKMKKYRSEIQMIFQDPYASLNPRMTVSQIIAEPLQIHSKISSKEIHEKVLWLLEKVGLQPEQSNRFPHEFSGGQRQRIGIARALATNPKLIVCDEPVSALDVSIQAQVINLMMDLQEEFNLSYLFIAHDLSVVEHISDKIIVMYLGNIVEIGKSSEIYHNPKHPYTKALISAVPQPDPKNKNKRRIILKGDIPTPMNKPSGCAFRTRCPIAKSECANDIPILNNIGEDHFVACPFYLEEF
ncbi:MAG: peptide ABC transporter substrate-binding protein [Candidatus Marinimicrobia bacterium]|nr:peptide ABC transporter substrate-binding protein [Candidatus Neomarinimicrobiota bacterium]